MKTFLVWLENEERPVYRGNSRHMGIIDVRVSIGSKIYMYHCFDSLEIWKIIKQLGHRGAEWKALNRLKKEAESFEKSQLS
jgi:hypothetical protein